LESTINFGVFAMGGLLLIASSLIMMGFVVMAVVVVSIFLFLLD
jgi:hypothetical protein